MESINTPVALMIFVIFIMLCIAFLFFCFEEDVGFNLSLKIAPLYLIVACTLLYIHNWEIYFYFTLITTPLLILIEPITDFIKYDSVGTNWHVNTWDAQLCLSEYFIIIAVFYLVFYGVFVLISAVN